MTYPEYLMQLPAPFEWSALFNYGGFDTGHFPHAHAFFQFSYVLEGELNIDFPGGEQCPLHEGELIVISPDVPHLWHSGKDISTRAFTFLAGICTHEQFGRIADLLAPWVRNTHWRTRVEPDKVASLIERLIEVRKSKEITADVTCYGLNIMLLALFSESVISEYGLEDQGPIPVPVAKSLHFMEKNYMKMISLGEIAADAGISVSRFSALFNDSTGRSPMQYLNGFRLNKAQSLLIHSRLGMEEIAKMTGFNSIHYFSRAFRKMTGCPPAVFRRQHQG